MNVQRTLSGKVAVVTASSTGIGLAIAKRLAQDGARVVISSRKQENVDAAVQDLKGLDLDVIGIKCHVGLPEDRKKLIEETVRQLGGIDILVGNAAINPTFEPILSATEAVWDKIFDVNVKSMFFLCKEAIPYMEKRGGGSIVIVSSVGGYNPQEGRGVYAVSKTALLGLCKAMANQCAEKNIRVNCVAPGLIKTKFSQALWSNPQLAKRIMDMTALKRIGEPEECAGVVSFLSSDDASYITAETIVVSGGASARL